MSDLSPQGPPYRGELAMAETVAELTAIWAKYSPAPAEVAERMAADFSAKRAELAALTAQGITPQRAASALEALAALDDQSLQATLDLGDALNDFAEAHTRKKTLEAQLQLLAKARKFPNLSPELRAVVDEAKTITDGMARMLCDADETMADARLQAYITEGKVKAARSKLDHIQRSFDYHRSLLVRESRVDGGR